MKNEEMEAQREMKSKHKFEIVQLQEQLDRLRGQNERQQEKDRESRLDKDIQIEKQKLEDAQK